MNRGALTCALVAGCISGCGHAGASQNAGIHLDRGAAALTGGDIGTAEAECELALEYAPGYAEAFNCIGLVRLAQGRDDDAIALFKRAIAIRPDFMEALNNLGNVYLGRREWASACELFSQAIEIDPGYVVARRNLGTCLMHAGKPEEARRQLIKCTLLDARACDCRLGLGVIALGVKDWPAATRELEQLIGVCPEMVEAHYNLCWVYFEQGQCQAAVHACQTALKREPGYLEAQQNLAKAAACAARDRERVTR